MTARLKLLCGYYVYLFLLWGAFRYFVRLPEVVEELCFKPILWLSPVFWLYISYRGKIDLFAGNKLKSLWWGTLAAVLFFVVFRLLFSEGRMAIDSRILLTAPVTAIVEQLVFAGFLLPALMKETKNESLAISLAAVAFGLIRIPFSVFVLGAHASTVLGVVLLSSSIQMINNFLRLRTNNTLTSILSYLGVLIGLAG